VKLAGLGIPLRSAKFAIRRMLRRSDLDKWSRDESFRSEWDDRTQRLAALVSPNSRVVELGAAGRRLERYLPPGCTYVPCDITSRGEDTIVFDLNQHPLPDLGELAADVVIVGGTLEYVLDLPSVVAWLAGSVAEKCICSYATCRTKPRSFRRFWEVILRSSNGWMNEATEEEFVKIFANAGYSHAHAESWGVQRIFVFDKQDRRTGPEPLSPPSDLELVDLRRGSPR
jgi:hypothetical protein